MNDLPYWTMRALFYPPFFLSWKPLVLGREHVPREGGCLLAANHSSYFDIALLIGHYPRTIDYVADEALFRKPFARRFFHLFKPIPYRRSSADPGAVRSICNRLARGRTVGIFPEGGIRRGEKSVLHGGAIRPGLGRLAMLSQVPVIPAVVLGGEAYYHPTAWLPFRRTRFQIAFGEVMSPPSAAEKPGGVREQTRLFEEEYAGRMRALYQQLAGL